MLRSIILKGVRFLGYDLKKQRDPIMDTDADFIRMYNQCKPYTMTSKERMYALYKGLQYVHQANIPGDLVECGVWKGGSAMLMAMMSDRDIYLYDTFEGMTEPGEHDYSIAGKDGVALGMSMASLESVKANLQSTNVIFVKGKVEETIPGTMPGQIALLRLDTDWYESTRHELIHLYPLLAPGGVIIIDDYGHYAGAKKAVDEYFADKAMLLNRIDYTGRIGQKM